MRSSEASPTGRRWAGRRWLAAVACLVALTGLTFALMCWLGQRPSAEEQLRAIDAAHAVPDEENAALHYTAIALGNTGPSLDPQFLPLKTVQEATLAKAWCSTDFPEVAKWIEDRRATLDALLQASHRPRCWFPVSQAMTQRGDRFSTAYYGSHLLIQAANNDLGVGRVEAGLEKLLAALRMGEHFRAQVDPSDYSLGRAITAEGWKRVGELLSAGDIPPDWLARFAAVLPPVEDTWDGDFRREEEMSLLYMQQRRQGFGKRFLYGMAHGRGPGSKAIKLEYLRELTQFRVARILLELRRYKHETGSWPTDLSEIRRRAPEGTFFDPYHQKPFEYRRYGTTFSLQTSCYGRITGQ